MDVTLGTCRMMTQMTAGWGTPQMPHVGEISAHPWGNFSTLISFSFLVVRPRRPIAKDFWRHGELLHWTRLQTSADGQEYGY